MNQSQRLKLRSMTSTAAVAGYIGLVAIALIISGMSIASIEEQHASLSAAESMLAQLEGRSPSSHKDDGSPMNNAPAGSPFLEGQDLNVAGAALLQRIAATVRRVGGNVLSSQVDLDSPRAKDGWVGLLVSCDIEQTSLQELLYDVEAGMPFLFIDELSIEGPKSSTEGNRMRIVMGVSGQWLNGR